METVLVSTYRVGKSLERMDNVGGDTEKVRSS
jgi:hypothetical protein